MKKKTRMVSLLLVCIMLCGMLATTAFASGGHGREYGIVNTDGTRLRAAADPYNSQNILGLLYIGEKMLIDIDPASSYGYYVTGTDGKTWARGVDKPTNSWDLTDKNYNGSFSGVEAGVYTNYYFTGVGYIVVSFDDLRTDAEDCVFQFWLIDLTDSTGSSTAKSVRLKGGADGEYAVGTYTNLNTSHKYCVFMRTVNPGEAASGKIYVSGV